MPTSVDALEIRAFNPSVHDRRSFDCGHHRLNNYLKLTAKKATKDNMARLYVVVEPGQTRVLAYLAMNAGRIDVDLLPSRPKATPAHGEIPVLFVGFLACDRTVQGQGIGGMLVHYAFAKAQNVAEQVGCYAVVIDVVGDPGTEAHSKLKAWYEDFGFIACSDNAARMFITMKQVRDHLVMDDPTLP